MCEDESSCYACGESVSFRSRITYREKLGSKVYQGKGELEVMIDYKTLQYLQPGGWLDVDLVYFCLRCILRRYSMIYNGLTTFSQQDPGRFALQTGAIRTPQRYWDC